MNNRTAPVFSRVFSPVFSVFLLLLCAACEGESGAGAATTAEDTDEFWAVDAGPSEQDTTSQDATADTSTKPPDGVDPTCYAACLQKGQDEAACEVACKGKGSGGGKGGADSCATAKDDSKDPKDAALYDQNCMASCAAKKVSVGACKCYCPAKSKGGGGEPSSDCYDVCVKLGADKAGCAKECDAKGSGLTMSGAEACYNVCVGGGSEAADCKAQCYPKGGK